MIVELHRKAKPFAIILNQQELAVRGTGDDQDKCQKYHKQSTADVHRYPIRHWKRVDVVGIPGRVIDQQKKDLLLSDIKIVVLDEADRCSIRGLLRHRDHSTPHCREADAPVQQMPQPIRTF
jgi:hypothetical protein